MSQNMNNRNRRDLIRPPILRSPPMTPRGPLLTREPADKGYQGKAAVPPDNFVGGNNSQYEWQIYHALAKVTGEPKDPRMPPFIGAPGIWSYQKAWDDGRHMPGGSVIDFVVYAGGHSRNTIAVRVQTEHFHIFASQDVQAYDMLQYWRLSEFFQVIDVYDSDFAWDPTNAAACSVVADMLAGKVFPNPITNGTSQRVARQKFVSV